MVVGWSRFWFWEWFTWLIVAQRNTEADRDWIKIYMNISTKKIVAGIVTVLAIIDAGLVVSASDTATPGQMLYQVDLAMEKIQVYLAPVDTQADLKFKFTDERISEVEQLIKGRRTEAGQDSIDFTVRESNDINTALKDVGIFLEKNKDANHKNQIEKHLAELLALIELDKNVHIERHGGTFEMEDWFIDFWWEFDKIVSMDKLKFGLFSIVVLSLIGLAWYWSVKTIESGDEHNSSVELSQLQKENGELKTQVSLLTEQLTKLTPAKTDTEETPEPKPATTPTPTPKPTTPTTAVNKNQTLINELQKLADDNVSMKLKSSGTRVGTLQKFLNIYNNTSTKIDNDYGATTVKLVTDFQKDQGLTASGEAGATTFKKMIEWLKKNWVIY